MQFVLKINLTANHWMGFTINMPKPIIPTDNGYIELLQGSAGTSGSGNLGAMKFYSNYCVLSSFLINNGNDVSSGTVIDAYYY